jgi:hypothetical protein
MSVQITWNAGGEATVAVVNGVQVTVHSSKPYPPGAPVPGTLHASDGDRAFTIKVAGSRKIAEATWEVRGRLVTATSDVLAAFARSVT